MNREQAKLLVITELKKVIEHPDATPYERQQARALLRHVMGAGRSADVIRASREQE